MSLEKPPLTMADVKRPKKKSERINPLLNQEIKDTVFQPALLTSARKIRIKTSVPEKISWPKINPSLFKVSAISLMLAGAAIILSISLKQSLANSLSAIYEEFSRIKNQASELKTEVFLRSLEKIDSEVKKINNGANHYWLTSLAYAGGIIFAPLKQLPAALKNASALSSHSLNLAKDLSYLKNEALDLMLRQKGARLISLLADIQKNAEEINKANENFARELNNFKTLPLGLASFSEIFEKNYQTVNSRIPALKNFLNGLVNLINQPDDWHILFILQNPSEMRPAGGFIGSFGDLTINQGNLKEVYVDDIYNADRQLQLKIIPPTELRQITEKWGARDANWFFDFPVSARKVISLLEESDLYQNKKTQFEGAIAINPHVLETILEAVGPIKLDKYNLAINHKNFLREIQREVEAGQDKKPGQNPKRILSALAPLIMEKLKSLDKIQKETLAEKLKAHIGKKDIMFYARDWRIQAFFEKIGIAGDVFQLPKNFSGDYLAVINANIGGGKSDAVTSQTIILKSFLNLDGLITNELSITKTNNGQNEKEWWYRLPNKTYFKILVPPKSELKSVDGNNELEKRQAIKYAADYEYDADLISVEQNANLIDLFKTWVGKESGKRYFGTWFTTPVGKTKTLTINYQNGVKLNIRNNLRYEFIFEKQSGMKTTLQYSVFAPPGYIWQESKNNEFTHNANDLKSREKIELTLIKEPKT